MQAYSCKTESCLMGKFESKNTHQEGQNFLRTVPQSEILPIYTFLYFLPLYTPGGAKLALSEDATELQITSFSLK